MSDGLKLYEYFRTCVTCGMSRRKDFAQKPTPKRIPRNHSKEVPVGFGELKWKYFQFTNLHVH